MSTPDCCSAQIYSDRVRIICGSQVLTYTLLFGANIAFLNGDDSGKSCGVNYGLQNLLGETCMVTWDLRELMGLHEIECKHITGVSFGYITRSQIPSTSARTSPSVTLPSADQSLNHASRGL